MKRAGSGRRPSPKTAAERLATAETLSAMATEEYIRTRAAKGERAAFQAFLDSAGTEPPCDGDVLP